MCAHRAHLNTDISTLKDAAPVLVAGLIALATGGFEMAAGRALGSGTFGQHRHRSDLF
jgi:hypothetical protein